MNVFTGLTASEMEYEAKVVYEAIASGDAPGYTNRQWSILLTQAQEKVVRQVILNGLDKDEHNRRVVSRLIRDYSTTDFKRYKWKNAFVVKLPQRYMYLLEDYVNDNIRVVPKSYDYVHANKDNPFEKPKKEEYFWRIVHKDGAIIVTDGSELKSYNLSYLVRPTPIITKILDPAKSIEGVYEQTNCKLDPIVHRDIVNMAGKLAELYASNQLGYQLKTLEEHTLK